MKQKAFKVSCNIDLGESYPRKYYYDKEKANKYYSEIVELVTSDYELHDYGIREICHGDIEAKKTTAYIKDSVLSKRVVTIIMSRIEIE